MTSKFVCVSGLTNYPHLSFLTRPTLNETEKHAPLFRYYVVIPINIVFLLASTVWYIKYLYFYIWIQAILILKQSYEEAEQEVAQKTSDKEYIRV